MILTSSKARLSMNQVLNLRKNTFLRTELFIEDNGVEISVTVTEFRSGLTEPNMRGIGATIKLTDKANFGMLMEMSTTASGKKTKLLVEGSTSTSTGQSTRVTGSRIYSMGKALKPGLMDLDSRGNTIMARNMVSERTYGAMAALTLGIGMIIKYKERERILGLMGGNSMGNGKTTICMGLGYIHGRMVEDMKVST